MYLSNTEPIPAINLWHNRGLDEEVTGESIIVIDIETGYHWWYISEEARGEVIWIMDLVQGQSLMVDGIMYRLRTPTLDHFLTDEGNIFLGEVESTVSRYQLPAEDFQVNRDFNVSARIYRLRNDAVNNIVIIRDDGTHGYFSVVP